MPSCHLTTRAEKQVQETLEVVRRIEGESDLASPVRGRENDNIGLKASAQLFLDQAKL
jgi:hypothetical protein